MDIYADLVANGILFGGLYALASLGLSLQWGVMGVLDLSQGAYVMIGAYVAYAALALVPQSTLVGGIAVAFVAAAIVGALLGFVAALIQRAVLSRIVKSGQFMVLVATLGISLVYQDLVYFRYSGIPVSVPIPQAQEAFDVFGFRISQLRLVTFVVAVLAIGVLHLWLTASRAGRIVQATGLNRKGVTLLGIEPRFVDARVAGIATFASVIAGALYGSIVVFTPSTALTLIARMFAVALFAGLGNVWGLILAGGILGVAESIGGFAFGLQIQLLASAVIVVLVLLLRPHGLAGRKFFAESDV